MPQVRRRSRVRRYPGRVFRVPGEINSALQKSKVLFREVVKARHRFAFRTGLITHFHDRRLEGFNPDGHAELVSALTGEGHLNRADLAPARKVGKAVELFHENRRARKKLKLNS